jgi:prepilin-type N-terminal cleavage/methylation domain-containing protein
MSSNNKGFSVVEILIVVAVVGLIGFVGWKVYDNRQSDNSKQQASTEQQDADAVPAVNGTSDLKESEDYLNSQDIDKELDTTELDEALAE